MSEKPTRTSSKNLSVLTQLWPFLQPYRTQMLVAGVALVLGALTVLSFGLILREIIDRGFASGELSQLTATIGLVFIAVFVMAAVSYTRFYAVSWLGERVVADIRSKLFAHLLSLSPEFYEETKVGEVSSRLTTDTTLLQTVIGSSISFALRNFLTMLGALVLMLITSPKLTAVVLLMVPLVLGPVLLFGRRVRTYSRASQDRIADIGARSDETLVSIRTVQAFTQERAEADQFAQAANAAFGVALKRIRVRALLTASITILALGSVAVMAWIGGRDVILGNMTAGTLTSFVFYAIMVATAAAAISEFYGEIQRAAGATERLMELLATQPLIAAPVSPATLTEDASLSITFDQATFRYPARPDEIAVNALSFDVQPGETVAIVGPSGAGKTTLFQLLLRFYGLASGKISVANTDIADFDPVALRSLYAWVGQEPVVFSGSVLENIRYGAPDATDVAVRDAAKLAAADEFITALPEGYDTFVGERGVRLSGGQRQRIAIARALLRDPKILLLDEATSALDAESEQLVQHALENLMRGRTTLVIAHRLATVRQASRILVMDRGALVETGTHDELIAQKGLYARLAKIQFSD